MAKVVEYTNTQGFKEFRVVPDAATPSDYRKGALAGPPDLSDLDLSYEERKKLQNLLVDADMKDYGMLKGRRGELVNILKQVRPQEDVRPLRNAVLALYQQAYYQGDD